MSPQRFLWIGLLLVSGTALRAQEGGIEIFSGEMLFETGFRVSVTHLHKTKDDLFDGSSTITDPFARKLTEDRSVLGIDYGLDRDFGVSVLVPWVRRELESGGTKFNASGPGDLALLGKYRLLRHEGQASGYGVALVGGLEVPTGETDEVDQGLLLAPSLQPGTGAWNPFAAISGTYGVDRARFDATVFYKMNTEGAQQLESGDFLSVSVAAAYRFLHFKYPGPTFGARLGLQWRHEGRATSAGVRVANSGADELLLNPALSIHPIPSMDLNLGVRIPILQDYQGQQLGRGTDYFAAVGIRF
ncbi:MAG: transporter [Planctomycetota bacterium]|nr:MAG: transporter [Planctomycetota bacterium]